MFALLPLGAVPPQVTHLAWSLRSVLLACLAAIVALAGDAYRTAQDDAARRRDESVRIGRALRHASTHDGLTGLPNRTTAGALVESALLDRDGGRHAQVAVLVVDLDRFKNVNDSLGHQVGDDLLRQVAERLLGVLEPDHRLARLGGDEFAVICLRTDLDQAVRTAQHVVDAFARPVSLLGADHRIGLSVGVAVSGDGLEAAGDLFRAADAALYAAKDDGRGRVRAFDPGMREAAEADLAVERRLRDVLELQAASGMRGLGARRPAVDAIRAVFQPVVDLRTGLVTSAEALARWDLDGRPVSPLRFVPMAEELGLGTELTLTIAEQAVAALASWREVGCTTVRSVAVNVGPRDLLRPGLALSLAGLVRDAGLEPGSLTLEITERDIVGDVDEARAALEDLRAVGITVAIDDFGTGFSSLAYLARLPVQVLKIDRAFVATMGTDDTIARVVVDLARSFGMRCIAEGIETAEQLRLLTDLGADGGQGWHCGRPQDAASFVTQVLGHPTPA
jgi:diguanylate cyclase (GGDEF)-like protein